MLEKEGWDVEGAGLARSLRAGKVGSALGSLFFSLKFPLWTVRVNCWQVGEFR